MAQGLPTWTPPPLMRQRCGKRDSNINNKNKNMQSNFKRQPSAVQTESGKDTEIQPTVCPRRSGDASLLFRDISKLIHTSYVDMGSV